LCSPGTSWLTTTGAAVPAADPRVTGVKPCGAPLADPGPAAGAGAPPGTNGPGLPAAAPPAVTPAPAPAPLPALALGAALLDGPAARPTPPPAPAFAAGAPAPAPDAGEDGVEGAAAADLAGVPVAAGRLPGTGVGRRIAGIPITVFITSGLAALAG
jgi:hypothetical protein